MKNFKYRILNDALYVWFLNLREKGVPLSRSVVQEKSKILASKLDDSYKVFCTSSGWLDGWKSHYGIRQLTVS